MTDDIWLWLLVRLVIIGVVLAAVLWAARRLVEALPMRETRRRTLQQTLPLFEIVIGGLYASMVMRQVFSGNATIAAIAVMGAYFFKGVTGKGQFIELSKQEALISMQRVESVTYPNDGICMTRNQGKAGPKMLGGVMPCKDGFVVVLTPEEHQWKSLMTLIGDPEWSQKDWCQTQNDRSQHVDEINQYLLDWMGEHTEEEIFREGQALGCPVAPLQSAEKVVNSAQLNSRGFFKDLEHPELGRTKFPTAPYHFKDNPWQLDRSAPHLGEHNAEIFTGRLGLDGEELTRLKEAGAI